MQVRRLHPGARPILSFVVWTQHTPEPSQGRANSTQQKYAPSELVIDERRQLMERLGALLQNRKHL